MRPALSARCRPAGNAAPWVARGVSADDDEIADICRQLRNHGLSTGGEADYRLCGYNFRMSDVHAALGLPQLIRIDEILRKRAELACLYSERLHDVPDVATPTPAPQDRHSFQSYVALLSPTIDRDLCIKLLRERGIESGVGARAIHMLPFYRMKYGYKEEDLPNAARAARSALALPLFPAMAEEDVERVADALRSVLRECGRKS
jgi:perosamine synthetase